MSVLHEADEIINGARQSAYGHPFDNHTCTAQMWSAYLTRRAGFIVDITPEDVCWLNVLQKVSRQANRHKRDNIVDAIGYAACVELVELERANREKLCEGGS